MRRTGRCGAGSGRSGISSRTPCARAPAPDVALINAGTLRRDDVIPAGPVTTYQLESMFLFPDGTRVVVFPASGARLREILEHGVSARNLGRGGFLQVSGVRFRYDPARPTGDRIVGPVERPDGRVVGPSDTVRLAFPVYPACHGGDGYQVPEAAGACRAAGEAPRAVDLLIRHLEAMPGGVIAAPDTGRIQPVGR